MGIKYRHTISFFGVGFIGVHTHNLLIKFKKESALGISLLKSDHIPALTGMAQLGIIPQSERLLVRFPIRVHSWVAAWSHLGHVRGSTSVFLSFSLPSFPSL